MPGTVERSERAFRLVTLGGMQLLPPHDTTEDEAARAALLENRRRALALLVVLACSPRALSRDTLADFFWGDSEPVRARHSLAEALRLLRQVLGADALPNRASDVQLATDSVLDIDAARFDAAIAAGDDAAAFEGYVAPFLDGVYVERAPRFEQWAAEQREHRHANFLHVCERECRRHEAMRDWASMAHVASRWLNADLLSFEAAHALFTALLAPGSSSSLSAARGRFEGYARRLHDEFEEEPAPELELLFQRATDRIRSAPPTTALDDGGEAAPVAVPRAPTLPLADAGPGVASPPSPNESTAASDTQGRRRARWRPAVVSAAALPLLAMGWFVSSGARATAFPSAASGTTRTAVVVADAEVAAQDSMIGAAVTLAMSTALNESDGVRVLAPSRVRRLRELSAASDAERATIASTPLTEAEARTVAVRAGAAAVLVPIVVRLGEDYRVAARVVHAADSTTMLSWQSKAVKGDALLSALDDVVRRARRYLGGSAQELRRAVPLPEYSTASLVALQQYAQGVRAFNAQKYDRALEWYRAAVATDSTFAVAWQSLGRTLMLSNVPLAADSAFRRAMALVDRLSPRERVIVQAAMANAHGLRDSAVAIRARWLDVHPDDVDLLRSQAYDLLTSSRPREANQLYAVLVQRDSSDDNAWTNLALSYQGDDSTTRRLAVDAYARGFALDPSQLTWPNFAQFYGGLLTRAAMYDSAQRVFESQYAAAPRNEGRVARAHGQMELWRGRPREAIAPFRRAVAASMRTEDTLSAVRSRLWLEAALDMSGDERGAAAERQQLARDGTLMREPAVLYWIGARLARRGDVAAASRLLDVLRARRIASSRTHDAMEASLTAEVGAARGRATSVVALAERGVQGDSSAITLSTLAHVLRGAGREPEAVAIETRVAEGTVSFGSETWLARERVRLARRRAADRRKVHEIGATERD